jgi:hypothetical protein
LLALVRRRPAPIRIRIQGPTANAGGRQTRLLWQSE